MRSMSIRVAPPRISFSEKLKLMLFKIVGVDFLDYETLIKIVQNRSYIESIYNFPYKRRRYLYHIYRVKVLRDLDSEIKRYDRERAVKEKECGDICKSGNVYKCKDCNQELAKILRTLNYYVTLKWLIDVVVQPLRLPIIRSEYLQLAYNASSTTLEFLSRGLEVMGSEVEEKAKEVIENYKALQRELKLESELEEKSLGDREAIESRSYGEVSVE